MESLKYPHLFLDGVAQNQDYTSTLTGRDNLEFPESIDRNGQASFVRNGLENAWKRSKEMQEARKAVALPTRNGTYIQFDSNVGFDLNTKSLDLKRSGIRLLTVWEGTPDGDGENAGKVTKATVYVPAGKERILLDKVEKYQTEFVKDSDKPKNQALINSIGNISEAIFESFWRDPIDLLPTGSKAEWCEIWLRYSDNADVTADAFNSICKSLRIEIKEGLLNFPERLVFVAKTTRNQLTELLNSSDDIAEFRRAKETANFWLDLENSEQSIWVQNLASRLNLTDTNCSVCILDTGVNNGHALLSPIIRDADCHSVLSEWGTADTHGHGTLMSGVVAFSGKLDWYLQTDDSIEIPFRLESVKLIPSPGQHHSSKLYGYHTKQAISRAEVENPELRRISCLAITSDDGRDNGRPSSWSGALDQLASGAEDGTRRLIVAAGGNIRDPSEWQVYPDSNITNQVHDPGQAWNVLTVGSVTSKTIIEDEELSATYTPIASEGQLSPFSTTSYTWDSKWPNKPDVVFEGGNAGIDSSGFATELDDLSILTTHYKPQESQLGAFVATSASTAQIANFAAQISARYPNMWPETIRGLIVHSADWPLSLWEQFYDPYKSEKDNIERMLRVCGYGVPDFDRAIECATNSLTLIAQEEIQPYCHRTNKGGVTQKDYKTKDMHLFELPWPTKSLGDLPGETQVKINVTLSYFVEPGPGEIGWRDKYRYRSHALDFNMNRPTENASEFITRINKAARDNPDGDYGGSSVEWAIGPQSGRTRGSVHRDWFETTAANAARCNYVGIFPRTGWWKDRYHLGKGNQKTRYSLIVSISTVETNVDLYTPVAAKIPTKVEISS